MAHPLLLSLMATCVLNDRNVAHLCVRLVVPLMPLEKQMRARLGYLGRLV